MTSKCRYCNQEIEWERDEDNERWMPVESDSEGYRHRCNEQREAWQAEQETRTGRSEAQLCRNGCGTLVFWNYDVRSRKNNKPLPFEETSNTLHRCPNYNLSRKK